MLSLKYTEKNNKIWHTFGAWVYFEIWRNPQFTVLKECGSVLKDLVYSVLRIGKIKDFERTHRAGRMK